MLSYVKLKLFAWDQSEGCSKSQEQSGPNTLNMKVAVLGAGVIGLAVARRLAFAGHEVFILERRGTFGSQSSSRNSEVIHAGIYYKPGSLKALLCKRGKEMLYRYSNARGVPHKAIGKFIVDFHKTSDPNSISPALEAIQKTSKTNGVPLIWKPAAELERVEPEVYAPSGALWSPTTGIISSHELMLALLADGEFKGVNTIYNAEVKQVLRDGNALHLQVSQDTGHGDMEEYGIEADIVVNCAGFGAPETANMLTSAKMSKCVSSDEAHHQDVTHTSWASYACIGRYYRLPASQKPFRHLIYPVPPTRKEDGLGVHATVDLEGGVRFGPDAVWIEKEGIWADREVESLLQIPDQPEQPFTDAIARYYPAVKKEDLLPDYAGMRAKILPMGAGSQDFTIEWNDTAKPSALNLLGIESPGLTSSLAIAEVVHRMLEDRTDSVTATKTMLAQDIDDLIRV
eukprot:Clim_evm257s157 gene=Clim_evmTU257s157